MANLIPKWPAAILLLLSLCAHPKADPVRIGTDFNTVVRPSGRVRQDILALQRELQETVRLLDTVYMENPQELKEEKVAEAQRLWNKALPMLDSLADRIVELFEIEGETHFVSLARGNRSRTQGQIEDLCRRVARMSPLDLLARAKALRPAKLMRDRRFYSVASSEPVSGEALFQEMVRGYRAYFLRTKTTLLQAQDIFQKIGSEHPDFFPAQLWNARALFELGKAFEAVQVIKGLVVHDPDLRVARSLDLELLEHDELFLYHLPPQPVEEIPNVLPVLPAVKDDAITPCPYAIAYVHDASRIRGLSQASVVMEHAGEESGWVGLYSDFQEAEKRRLYGPLGGLHGFALQYLVASRALIVHAGVTAAAEGIRWHLDYRTVDPNDASMEMVKQGQYPHQLYYVHPFRLDETALRMLRKAKDPLTLFSVSETGYPYQGNTAVTVSLHTENDDVVSFSRQGETGQWQRSFNGVLTLDSDGRPLFSAENLLIQKLDEPSADQPAIGKGEFTAYLQGVRVKGRWTKPSEFLPTVYLTEDGNPLKLAPGRLWLVLWSGRAIEEGQ